MAKTVVDLDTLKINVLTQAQYNEAALNDEIEEDEIYLTPSSGTGVTDVEVDGVSVVSGGVAEIESEVFYVTFTWNSLTDTYSADKTYNEVLTAITNNKCVCGIVYDPEYESDYFYAPLYFYSVGEGEITFTNVKLYGYNLSGMYYTLFDTNTVAYGDYYEDLAPSSHSHGNITSGGDITSTATIANGDRLVINDESASKVTNSSITFGSSTSQYLANNGTWQNVPSVPTVNNATLTIQKNGATVNTFTANASSNVTANITVHDVPSGGSAGQVLTKDSNTDYDLVWSTVSGGSSKNFWFGTCSTGSTTATKVITTTSGDFTLTAGNMLRVLFRNKSDGGPVMFNVDSTGTKSAYSSNYSASLTSKWSDYEVVDFVYTSDDQFVMLKGVPASTTYYGITKLSNSISNDQTTALTPKAVYDAGFLTLADLPIYNGGVS